MTKTYNKEVVKRFMSEVEVAEFEKRYKAHCKERGKSNELTRPTDIMFAIAGLFAKGMSRGDIARKHGITDGKVGSALMRVGTWKLRNN